MNQKPLFLVVALVALLTVSGAFFVMEKYSARNAVQEYLKFSEMVSEKSSQNAEISSVAGEKVWYQIPELGIRIRLKKDFANDLVYFYSKSGEKITKEQKKYYVPFHEAVHFSSRSLLRREPECKPGTRAIGYFVKESGKIEEWPAAKYFVDRVQLPNYFVALGIPLGEDNPKAPMCMFSENSQWALSGDNHEETEDIESYVSDQSDMLQGSFRSLEPIP